MGALARAFANSRAGLYQAVTTERAVRQEFIVLVMSVPAAFVIGPTSLHRALLIGAVLLVLAVELLNTCVEKLCDHVTPAIHPDIKRIKDMGSAAVLCAICAAALLWIVSLIEKLAG